MLIGFLNHSKVLLDIVSFKLFIFWVFFKWTEIDDWCIIILIICGVFILIRLTIKSITVPNNCHVKNSKNRSQKLWLFTNSN